MALYQRGAAGEGQHIDLSLMEGTLDHIENKLTNFLQLGTESRRGPHQFAPWGLYRCADGYVTVIGAPFRHWTRGAQIFQEPRLQNGKYRHVRDRAQHRDEVNDLVQTWLSRHKRKEICHAGVENDLAFGYLASFDEVIDSPQHEAREFFVEVDHPSVGAHKYSGAPFKMSATPWQSEPAPLLGEHNQTVYQDLLGYTPQQVDALRQEGVI
jgi:crotonobetainyl-CoA:carnitine CoA-transferase CaiB-like acyl-CoA transferase